MEHFQRIWPCTVFKARLPAVAGTAWVALPMDPNEVPFEALGDEEMCREWFEYNKFEIIGFGESPDEAVWDLISKKDD